MMTKRENILSALRRKGYDHVPIDMTLCPSQLDTFRKRTGLQRVSEYFQFDHRSINSRLIRQFADPQILFPGESLPESITFDDWGIGHSKGSEAALHMDRMHHPLMNIDSDEQIEGYPFPTIDQIQFEKSSTTVKEFHEKSFAVVGHMSMTIWETSWYLRSMEALMMDMMMGDRKAEILLDKVTSVSCERAAAYATCGVDILHLGDDIGTQRGPMMSVEMWSEWLKPRLKKVIDSARSIKPDILIFYHSCGDVVEFVDGLIEAGVDILNPIQPECMSFEETFKRAEGRLSFWGTIGTQQLLPFGTTDDVRKEVKKILDICGPSGGIVIGPTHVVEPEVPWENLVALVETAKLYK